MKGMIGLVGDVELAAGDGDRLAVGGDGDVFERGHRWSFSVLYQAQVEPYRWVPAVSIHARGALSVAR